MEMTIEQKRALALARARQRAAQAKSGEQQERPRSFGQGAMAEPGAGDALQRGLVQGATFGFGDELVSAAMTPFEMIARGVRGDDAGAGLGERVSNAYGAVLDDQRGMDRAAEQRNPVASIAGNVVGGVATGGQLARGGATLLSGASPTYGSMIGRGAAEGALYGGAYGLGMGEGGEDRVNQALFGAGLGAVGGGAVGAIGARGAQRAVTEAAPSVDDLRASAQRLYDQADQIGFTIKPQRMGSLVDDITSAVRGKGINARIHPQSAAALRELERAKGQPMTLRQMETLRQVANDAAQTPSSADAMRARMIVDRIDDFMAGATPRDATAGDIRAASGLLKEARGTWSQLRKAETINKAFENARNAAGANYTQAGMETALRQQFRAITRSRQFKNFSADERKAILRVVRGGPVENALRLVGKFAPRGPISAAPGAAAMTMIDPATGAMIWGVGEGARRAASAATQQSARGADTLVRSGQSFNPSQISGPRRMTLESLVSGGAAGITGTSQ